MARSQYGRPTKGGGASATPWRPRALRVLVDMDGVLCDFEGYFLKLYREKYPHEPYIPLKERRVFYVDQQYKDIRPDLFDICRGITESEGFFRNLPPIEGAVNAVKEMSGMENVEVFLCSSPLTSVPNSVKEKFEWVQEHLGRDWIRRLVLSQDKTVVAGDILIDDRPKIRGVEKTPSWDHILFTSCHNVHMKLDRLSCARRLNNWTDGTWKDLIDDYKRKI